MDGEHLPIRQALRRPWWLPCASAGSCRVYNIGLVTKQGRVTAIVMGTFIALRLVQVSC